MYFLIIGIDKDVNKPENFIVQLHVEGMWSFVAICRILIYFVLIEKNLLITINNDHIILSDALKHFGTNIFDAIILCRTLHFLQNIPQVLTDFRQMLKHKGKDS